MVIDGMEGEGLFYRFEMHNKYFLFNSRILNEVWEDKQLIDRG
jgi:hypothetical protein